MDDRCRCHLLLNPPDGPHWWPWHDPESPTDVRVVVQYGEQPEHLRFERTDGGWHAEGLLAAHAESTPPRPWGAVGRCWASVEHPVVDATA